MSFEEKHNEHLFAYGTLQTETVQLATFGRRLEGKPDALVGYRLTTVETEDQEFALESGTARHCNVEFTGVPSDAIEGKVFTVSRKELEKADAYEPSDYKRVLVQLVSGISAWVYLNGP